MKTKVMIVLLVILTGASSAGFCEILTRTVSYEHDGQSLEGFMAWDDEVEGRRPGVLVVHEWWGLNDYAKKRAKKIAALGYNAFALDMYGRGMVTHHPDKASEWSKRVTGNIELWQNRAMTGLEVLKQDARTDPGRLAAVGYCFGGSTVQQLAYAGSDLLGIVSLHGSLISPPEPVFDHVETKILICHGAADPLIKRETIPGYVAAMEQSGIDWQMIMYGDAKHAFTNPEADKAGMDAVSYNESADRRSWQHMKVFLNELF